MRGQADRQPKLFFSIDIEDRIRPDHPLRPLGRTVDGILRRLSNRFAAAYSRVGRPSVPPERLLGALLLMAIYSVRSERQLVERPLFKRTGTDLLFRWFLDMDPAEDAFDATVFTHNRRRLDEYGLTAAFFEAVVELAIDAGLVSDEHFTVDGTLIESCASIKSLRPVEDAAGTDTPPEGSGTDGSGTDGSGTDGSGTDGSGTDDSGTAGSSTDSNGTDSNGTDSNGTDSNSFKSRNPDVDFHGQKRSNTTHRSVTDPPFS